MGLADPHLVWALVVAGHSYTGPGSELQFFKTEAECASEAGDVGGRCVWVPSPPPAGTPEREAWEKAVRNYYLPDQQVIP
jgi:hypothetical protein